MPSYKRLYGFLTQAVTEDELDRLLAKMTVDGQLSQLRCPMLMVSGEYDLRDPVEEVFRLFDQVPGPAELWLFADQFHRPKFTGDRSVHEAILDWLEATLADTPPPPTGNPPGNRVRYIEPAAEGLTGPHVTFKRRWFEHGRPARFRCTHDQEPQFAHLTIGIPLYPEDDDDDDHLPARRIG